MSRVLPLALLLAGALALTGCGGPTAAPPVAVATTPAPTAQQQAQAQARARAHLSPFAQAAAIPSAAPFAWGWWDGENLLQSRNIRAETWQELGDFRADFELTGPEWDTFERELKTAFPLGLAVATVPGVACQGECQAFNVVILGRAGWGMGGFISSVQRDY